MTQTQFDNELLKLSDRLHFYAISLTTDTERANDLLQETFLKALTYRDKFEQNTNFKAWIYTIMKNTFINDYRRKIRTKGTFNGEGSEFHMLFIKDKVYPAPDSFYSSNEIYKTIRGLDEDYKVPFTLFLEGFKYKEIADELKLPIGTVKSRIFFTRKKLAKALHEYM